MACRRMGPLRVAVGLLDGPEARQRHLDMAGEPRPGPTRPGQKRQQGTAIFCNYDLNYKLHREDVPYRVYEYQRIPPLINQVPAKIRRTHVGLGIKSSCNPHKASRNSHLAPRQMKLPTEELHSIRRALSQIKAQVDSLLESLEHMDQQDDQPEGKKESEESRSSGSESSSCRTTESQQEPRDHRACPEADSSEENTDVVQVKNQASNQEGSQ
ncbi:RNA-binding Raly-like protein isoform X2 [Castor canadensis]|uniref:RNA-binding Raly-like protein isoform X2 n=1 Tax=Castor canadensis TaxID=51338 RepID=UPI003D172AB2